eukprot:UC4_evm6s924
MYCDEPLLCELGTDSSDCLDSKSVTDIVNELLLQTNCAYINDGVCDEPVLCRPGTDSVDCANSVPENPLPKVDASKMPRISVPKMQTTLAISSVFKSSMATPFKSSCLRFFKNGYCKACKANDILMNGFCYSTSSINPGAHTTFTKFLPRLNHSTSAVPLIVRNSDTEPSGPPIILPTSNNTFITNHPIFTSTNVSEKEKMLMMHRKKLSVSVHLRMESAKPVN